MLGKQSPWITSLPRSKLPSQADNHSIGLTTQQISQIARIFDSDAEDDGRAKARTAWGKYQSTRKRDAVYGYLTAVFEAVALWRIRRRVKTRVHQALSEIEQRGAIRSDEPFAVAIYLTSDPRKLNAKTRSKWSRALRYAERFKPDNQSLTHFIKSEGGINECAGQPRTT